MATEHLTQWAREDWNATEVSYYSSMDRIASKESWFKFCLPPEDPWWRDLVKEKLKSGSDTRQGQAWRKKAHICNGRSLRWRTHVDSGPDLATRL